MPSPECFTYLLRFSGGGTYVGISNNPGKRLRKYHAKAPSVCGKAIRKHGMPSLTVLCFGTRQEMADLERFLIAEMDPDYNIACGGEGMALRSPAAEQRRRQAISRAHVGKPLSQAHREAIRRARTGMRYPNRKPWSEATRQKMAESARRRWERDRESIMQQRQGRDYLEALSRGVKESWRNRNAI